MKDKETCCVCRKIISSLDSYPIWNLTTMTIDDYWCAECRDKANAAYRASRCTDGDSGTILVSNGTCEPHWIQNQVSEST